MRVGKPFGALVGTGAAAIGADAMFAAPALADEVPPEGQTAGTDISPIELTELVGPERGASASRERCRTNNDFHIMAYNYLGQTEAYGGHTTQFPVTTAWGNDDYRYRWIESPIASPTAIDYIHFNSRASGHYGGTYGGGGG